MARDMDPNKWQVKVRPKKPKIGALHERTRYKAIAPMDYASNYQDTYMFDSYAEAIEFAQRQALKAAILDGLAEWMDSDETVVPRIREVMNTYAWAIGLQQSIGNGRYAAHMTKLDTYLADHNT